jgi:PAS domain S-box-containing protein
LEPPKKDNWVSVVDAACLGIATCEGLRVVHCNDPFILMLSNQRDVAGKDVVTLLEQHARSTSRPQLYDIRRAIVENRMHHAEVDMEQYQWRICVHPLSDGFKRCILLSYRINTTAKPPSIHRGTFPILPHLREALPLSPPTQSPQSQGLSASPATSSPATHTSKGSMQPPFQPPNASSGSDMFFDLVENFPCGVAIVRAERHQDSMRFRMVSINRAARVFSNQLIIGKYFDESSPAPFDTAFVRVLTASWQTQERRIINRLNLYGSYLALAARTIPLRDQCVGIAFEEASVMTPSAQPQPHSRVPSKRSHSELDSGHLVLPSRKQSPIISQSADSIKPPSSPVTTNPDSGRMTASTISPSQGAHSTTASITPKVEAIINPQNSHESLQGSSGMIQDYVPPGSPSQSSNFGGSGFGRFSESSSCVEKMSLRHPHHPPTLPDINMFNTSLPKPLLPPFHSTSTGAISGILSPNGREKIDANVFQQCVIGIAYCDVSGELLLANRSFNQMLGHMDYDMVDHSILSLVSPDDVDTVKGALRQLACGEAHTIEIPLRFLHKRTTHPVWALTTLLMNKATAGGASNNIVMQVQQPVKLERFPEVLFSDRGVLRATVKDLAVATLVLEIRSASLQIIIANSAFCNVVGSREEELNSLLLTDILHPDNREKTTKAAIEIMGGRMSGWQLSVCVHSRVGPIWAVLSLSPVLDSRGKPLLLIAQLQPIDKAS